MTHNVTLDDCTGWINNTAQVTGTDSCGKNVTAAPASWNLTVECGNCVAGYKLNASSGMGLANWTITVKNSTGAIVATTTTDETGYWIVCGLAPGNYTACEVLPPGWVAVAPASGCHNITLNDTDWTNVNFTNREECNGSISDYVWLDTNQNGIQDGNESGLAGVTVRLYRHEDGNVTLIGTRVTNGIGYYLFDKLCAGNYSLQFIPPAGYAFTQQNLGNDEQDSDADPETGRTAVFYLGSGEINITIDAGLYLFEQVPALTPSGLIALIGLLSIIATSTLVRKRRT